MNSRALVFLAAGAAILSALFLLARPAASPPAEAGPAQPAIAAASAPRAAPSTPAIPAKTVQQFALKVVHKKLASGPVVLSVQEGDAVAITIVCDQAEELHLHGYNRKLELQANVPSTLEFVADRSGRFEYELEHSGIELGALEVQPR